MQITYQFKRRMVRVWAFVALPIIVALLLTSSSFAAPSQKGVSWDFKLLGPLNVTNHKDHKTNGLTIVIKGSGSIVKTGDQGTVSGGGTYTILEYGNEVGSGNWRADEYKSFDEHAPGNSPGQGGVLTLTADFDGYLIDQDQEMVIQCSMWDGANSTGPWPADFVRFGDYTENVSGAVMFHLNQQ